MEQLQIKTVRHYSDAFKREVVAEYLAGGITQAALQRKYQIGGKCAILAWRRKLGYSVQSSPDVATLSSVIPITVTQKKETQSLSELQQRIKELERQLQDERLRSEAFERIIDKAEKELKVPIRKKPNTR